MDNIDKIAWEPDPEKGEWLPPADPNVTCSPELHARVLNDFIEFHRDRRRRRLRTRLLVTVGVTLAVVVAAILLWMRFGG
jgi:hypothetical protein